MPDPAIRAGATSTRRRRARGARSRAGRHGAPSPFDLADRPAWDRHVLEAVAAIPWGRTASYGEIARQVGAPRAARAVGGAVGRNPISLLDPVPPGHRRGRHDRRLRRRRLGLAATERLAMKRDLLLREGVTRRRPPTG